MEGVAVAKVEELLVMMDENVWIRAEGWTYIVRPISSNLHGTEESSDDSSVE